jgi:hypothetical protein
MEKRLFRLALSIALVSFLGFSGCALYYQYQYHGWTSLLANYSTYADESFRRCGDLPTPAFVRTGECPSRQDAVSQPFEMPKRLLKELHASLWAAGIGPLAVLLLFYAGRRASVALATKKTVQARQPRAAGIATRFRTHAAIELIAMIENVAPDAFDSAEQIRNVRTQITAAVGSGHITVAESQLLMQRTIGLEHGFDTDA